MSVYPPFIYWIKFNSTPEPERIYARTLLEFKEILDRLVYRTGQMPEWIIRDYK